ncbi:hypothetical protein [Risungbinella massiliensis]|uniref:hypothetical protein n=1 Tax=Risungbinella massiliensis TaxID=1329796 RepID=UPI0005CBA0CC|nr:hypothetical protein [Risungbinella massiliensis]
MSSITVGVYLGKKDRLVRYWYEVLPKGQFPMLVKYCIQSYLRNNYFPLQSICDSRLLKEQIQAKSEYVPTQRNVTFTPEDGPVYQWIKSLESGYRSEEIKNILKETVVHTLLNDAPVYAVRPMGQATYANEAPTPYGYEDAQKLTLLKREAMMEDAYGVWDKMGMQNSNHNDLENKKEATNKNFSHLVNYLG